MDERVEKIKGLKQKGTNTLKRNQNGKQSGKHIGQHNGLKVRKGHAKRG